MRGRCATAAWQRRLSLRRIRIERHDDGLAAEREGAGNGKAIVNIDETGDTANTPAGSPVRLANGVLTIPGVAGTETFSGADTVNLRLGSGALTVAIDSTTAAPAIAVVLGTGTDSVTVGTGKLSAIQGTWSAVPT